ncbi:MAG: tetratricopeptide repeat protein [Betaproteobacteria bacterium]|nr:tetratricopeptide repeat protein [Betaproteobacteria bacterium]
MADEGEAKLAAEAIALYHGGRFREALAGFEALIDASPEPGMHCYWAGLATHALGEPDEAADHLVLAAHHLPQEERVWLALGEALLGAGRIEEALDALREGAGVASDPVPHLRAGASALKQLGRPDDAVAMLAKVVAARPEDALQRSVFALALLRAGRIEDAHAEAAVALRLDADCAEACHHAGLIERERGSLPAGLALFQHAFELRPDAPEVRAALAHALRDLGRVDEALAHYDAVLERHPGFPDAALNRAYLLLMVGRYAEGWDAYECRYGFPGFSPAPAGHAPWSGRSDEPVLVFGEQGIGDQVMFASCLPDLCARAAQVTIACNPRLSGILGRSFPRATVRSDGNPKDGRRSVGAAVSIASLPRHFRRSPGDFPARGGYLRADAERVAQWIARIGGEPGTRRVGLAWRGGSHETRGHLRSIPPRMVATLSGVSDVNWISLQYGDASADVGVLQGLGMHIARWAEIEQEIEDCAAAIQALDLVITIDNTVAHLAGALGKPVWILVSAGAEWRYGLERDRMPWYPSARLYRQRVGDGWQPVLRAVADQLAAPG